MESSRQLASIMFTDIVGYTALMGDDEQKAFALLKKNRQIQKPVIEQFNGRLIKELGDGLLASFPSATDSVYAAIRILHACRNTANFQFRIGIHLGEVMFEHEDVFGDGVYRFAYSVCRASRINLYFRIGTSQCCQQSRNCNAVRSNRRC